MLRSKGELIAIYHKIFGDSADTQLFLDIPEEIHEESYYDYIKKWVKELSESETGGRDVEWIIYCNVYEVDDVYIAKSSYEALEMFYAEHPEYSMNDCYYARQAF